MKAAAAVHQPSRGTTDDGADLLDAPDGPVAAIPLQSDLVNNVVLPHFDVFAPIVYAAEMLTGVSLMLGMFTRVFVVIGALQLHNITIYGLAFIPRRTSGRGLTSSCSCCN